MSVVDRWRAFERALHAKDLAWALHYAPPHLRWARRKRHPRGAELDHLLPPDYRAFVAEVGFPVIGFRYYDHEGISLLPPEPMGVISVDLADPDEQIAEARADGPTRCLHALFAACELSDIVGFSFGPGGGVWLVEDNMAREEVGSFTEWMSRTIDELERKIAAADPATIEEWVAENDGETDPHRLLDYALDGAYDEPPYAPDDLALSWVEHQDGTPYEYGLIDASGAWRIPMGRTFYSVRPFRGGVAEVIRNEPGSSYSGPWVRIRPDGSAA